MTNPLSRNLWLWPRNYTDTERQFRQLCPLLAPSDRPVGGPGTWLAHSFMADGGGGGVKGGGGGIEENGGGGGWRGMGGGAEAGGVKGPARLSDHGGESDRAIWVYVTTHDSPIKTNLSGGFLSILPSTLLRPPLAVLWVSCEL